jgi:two-component system OmpR family response regulator
LTNASLSTTDTAVKSTAGKKILIVEDFFALADIESLLCTMEGYDVRTVKSADEAMGAMEEFHPDLILLDLMLPGELSGSQFLDALRTEHGDTTKVLVISALVNSDAMPRLSQYSNVDTMTKPFKLADLSAKIQAILS